MSIILGINTKIWIIFIVLISGGLWFNSVFAQDNNTNSGPEKSKFVERVNAFDNLLDMTVSAPLTALSLTGATFLTRITKNNDDDPTYTRLMEHTKKNMIRAFVIFLACTIAIFIFDFIELLLPAPLLMVEVFDLAITYSLLFIGFAYLVVAAHKMYLTQAK
jgi:hypothetical protein